MIAKGSVAVDGTSLTINSCDDHGFSVSIIPHTAKWSTIGLRKQGDRVNIETDMIGKYVERFLSGRRQSAGGRDTRRSGLDTDFLMKTGFMD
jgi:riboflavin synthase